MKIKTKFPTAGSKVIIDSRWLGYHVTTRKDRLSIDPIYIRSLTGILLKNPTLSFASCFGELNELIPMFVDARNGMIRGNAFPAQVTINVAVGRVQRHIVGQTGCTSEIAQVMALIVLRALAQAQIVELIDGATIGEVYEVKNPLKPLFTTKVGDSIMGHILLADIVYSAIKKFEETVANNMKPVIKVDKGGFRSADVESVADAIMRAVHVLDLDVSSARGRIMPYLRSTYIVFSKAITDPSYVPVGMSDAEVISLLEIANAYYGWTKSPYTPNPTIKDEKQASSAIADLMRAVKAEKENVSLCQLVDAYDLQRAIEQFTISMPSDCNVGKYMKTGWMAPNAASFHTAVVVPYKEGVNLVRPDATLASNVQPFFTVVQKLHDYLSEKYNHSHLSVDGYTTDAAISQLSGPSGYDPSFQALLLETIARDVATDFSMGENGSLTSYVYMDSTNRHIYGSAAGKEVRERPTTAAADVVAHTALAHANGETLWKHPSLFGTLSSAITYISGIFDRIKSKFKELVGHVDFATDGTVVPTGSVVSFDMKLPNGQEVPGKLEIYSLMTRDVFAISDVWLEKDATVDLLASKTNNLLKEVIAMPEGKTREQFLVDILRIIGDAGYATLGDDVYTAMSKFVSFPVSYWTDHATQGMKLIRLRNCAVAMASVLTYLDFACAANISALVTEALKLPADLILKE